ncbi:hypothetical protein AMC83_PD00005 (plasmid) [Rhizobium phaseoli]|nr:hypothetical protein AMK02_PC00005 [Rhizobium sp. N731]ANL18497.1 hypothetical protein AMJ97_PC00005 [Rhizobium sp. N1314]ANL37088.1 hypothetical protein AMC89_PC00006 [Rhizobium phaseoli]ANL43466.1 hypothetical protein AMC88_PC00006 [Rhizobium phaseoli]ANL49710.1 hypothetical protein AMC87_PC00007 [Rhizobium phaseoli]
MSWKLRRVKQCAKCPWKVSTNPHDIPNGYSQELHQALVRTIAEPESLKGTGQVMACHEHAPGEEAHCVGWLMNQIGPATTSLCVFKSCLATISRRSSWKARSTNGLKIRCRKATTSQLGRGQLAAIAKRQISGRCPLAQL